MSQHLVMKHGCWQTASSKRLHWRWRSLWCQEQSLFYRRQASRCQQITGAVCWPQMRPAHSRRRETMVPTRSSIWTWSSPTWTWYSGRWAASGVHIAPEWCGRTYWLYCGIHSLSTPNTYCTVFSIVLFKHFWNRTCVGLSVYPWDELWKNG